MRRRRIDLDRILDAARRRRARRMRRGAEGADAAFVEVFISKARRADGVRLGAEAAARCVGGGAARARSRSGRLDAGLSGAAEILAASARVQPEKE